jgi:hypothetical protein
LFARSEWQRPAVLAALLLAGAVAAGCQPQSKEKKMLQEIPAEVREYLTAGDGLGVVSVIESHPNVERTLRTPEVRAAILRYLNSKEPWEDPAPTFTIKALAFLTGAASAKEAPQVRNLLAHPHPWVREKTAEYLMAVYFPANDRSAMTDLFQKMLLDDSEVVRVQAARWVRDFKAAAEMHDFLQKWVGMAAVRHWIGTESFEIVALMAK